MTSSQGKVNILVIGQTPPPYGGQALMIKYMLENEFADVQFYHVRMCSSREMNERGKVSLYKITHIFSIIKQVYLLKFKYKIDVLYYPPSNAPKISILRDIVLLLFTRFLFKKTVFHFHAAGISEELPKMNLFIRKLGSIALAKPDLAITSSAYNPKDGEYLKAKKSVIIPLGIPIVYNDIQLDKSEPNKTSFNVLFVGLMNSTKGEGVLLDAIAEVVNKGYDVKLTLAGKFESEIYKAEFFDKVEKLKLADRVEYLGVITGDVKHHTFAKADVFCFPSYFISESFGIVLLEAMQYKLPIIATRWRGIQSIVSDGDNGFLVDIKNSKQLAEKITLLIKNPQLRASMAANSQKLFSEKYTIQQYIKNLNSALLSLSKEK